MNNRVIILHPFLRTSGGSERITLEEEKYLRNSGYSPFILTFDFRSNIFSNSYKPKFIEIGNNNINWIRKIILRVVSLRKCIRKIDPIMISASNAEGCLYAYLSTLFTKYKYFSQIPSSGFDNIGSYAETLFTYIWSSIIFQFGYKKIRSSSFGHKMNLPAKLPDISIFKKIFSNIIGLLVFLAVRNARKRFVLSYKVQSEINFLYKRKAIVEKGAYPRNILNYKPKRNVRRDLKIENKKILFSLSRVVAKKRIDWLIQAIQILVKEGEKNIILLVGGTGRDQYELKLLTRKLNMNNYVIFTGFIPEEYLWDFYFNCDLFVSADYADYDISTYMAIAFNKNIVWPNDYEMDERLKKDKKIFSADLSPVGFATAIKEALSSDKLNKPYLFNDYSWETYFNNIYSCVLKKHFNYPICNFDKQ
jgi:glycosyltransferase involved in cell wall biosynthesis